MKSSEQINELADALAKAQSIIENPPKNREVEVVSKRTGGRYKFKYTTLDAILDTIRVPLTSNGLWFTHTLEQDEHGKFRLVTTLLHKSGQWIASEQPLFFEGNPSNQEFGSALTYAKRYAVSAMFGIASDDDDDANAADGNIVSSSKDRASKPQHRPATTAPKANIPPQSEQTADMPLDYGLPSSMADEAQSGKVFIEEYEKALALCTKPEHLDRLGMTNAKWIGTTKEKAPEKHTALLRSITDRRVEIMKAKKED